MPIVINTNTPALNSIQSMEKNKAELTSSMKKLSTGLKINKAADDAANLAIATRMAAQIGSLMQASANAQAGVSLINIADSDLGSIAQSITALRGLAIQAANGTLTNGDRNTINSSAESILAQINSVTAQSNFNGLNLLDGTLNTTLQVGTEAGDTIAIQINSANTANIGAVIVNGTAVDGSLRTGDLVIDGAAIGASVSDGLSFRHADASAISIANAINAAKGAGLDVHAVANATVTETTDFEESANTGGIITVNGVDTSIISVSIEQEDNVENAIVAVNTISSETGVVASKDAAGKLVFTAADGRNITIGYVGSIENTDFGAIEAGTTSGTVTLNSNKPITIGGLHPEKAGLTGGTTSTLTALDTADLSSQANAISSLAVIDGALDTISDMRSNLGAIENRLYSAIENLGSTSVNLQDAKSQIMDTDFAVEMANFAKLQILQHAGTMMLAHADAQPQNVLKLLQ